MATTSDREAELKLTAKTNFKEVAASEVAPFVKSVAKVGDAGEEAAAGLKQAEAAVSSIGVAEQKTAAASEQAAAAIREVGAASKQTGAEASAGSQQANAASQTAVGAANRQADATEAAGEAAKAAGAQTVTAAERSQKEIAELVQRWEQAITVAKTAGRSFDSAQAVAEIEQLATAIRGTGTDLGAQRTALKALADSIETEYRGMEAAAKKAGGTTVEQAKFTRDAIKAIETQIEAVDAELLRLAGTGDVTFAEIKRGASSFGDIANGAIKQVNSAWEQLNDQQRITPRQLGFATQAVELMRISMVEAGERGIAVTTEQIAVYERLEKEITDLTLRAHQLTNASKDNAVRLKETGTQVQGVAMGVQQLTSMLGPHAAKLGMVIGNVGQLGGLYENLKDSTKGLDLNTLSMGASAAKLGTQLGLVGTTAIAATAAGVGLARTSEENKEAIDGWWKSVKGLGSEMVSQFGAIQSEWNKLEAAQQAVWSASEQDRAKAMADMAVNHEGYLIALNRGKAAVDLYWLAIQAGIPMADASRAATNASAEALEFYATSAKAGAEGHEIMIRVMRESNGDQEKMNDLVRKYTAEMERAARNQTVLGKAQKEQQEAARSLADTLHEVTRALPSTDDPAGLVAMGEALEEAAKKSKDLNEAERSRYELIAQILKRGADMTAEEKKLAESLLAQVSAGKAASGMLNELARLQLSYGATVSAGLPALSDQFAVLKSLTGEWELNSGKITEAIAKTQTILDKTGDLKDAQRAQHQATIDGLRAVDEARAASAQMESDRNVILAKAENELKTRSLETTAAINKRLDDLARLVPLSEQYGAVTVELGEQLRDIASSSVTLSRTDRERLIVIADMVSKGHELTAGQRQLALDLIAAARAGEQTTASLNALARIQSELDTATGGTTAKITETINVIRVLSSEWGLNSAAIRVAVGELQSQLDSTTRLTNAQREHIQAIIDATNKQLESNAAVKASVVSLVAQIKESTAAYSAETSAAEAALAAAGLLATTLHGTADAYTRVDTATRKAIKAAEDALIATKGLSDEERNRALGIIQIAHELDQLQTREADNAKAAEARIGSLREEIAALQAKIELMDRAAGVSREQTAIDIDAGVSSDYLRQKQAALAQQLKETITSWAAAREATEHQVDAKAKLLEVLTKEKTAQELLGTSSTSVTAATSALTTAVNDGIQAFNNHGTAQHAAAAAASEAATHVQTMSIRWKDGSVSVRTFGDAAAELPPKIQAVADKATETAPIIAGAFAKWVEEGNIAKAKTEVDDLNASLATLLVNANAGDAAMFNLASRIGAVGAAAAKAAGERAVLDKVNFIP